MNERVWCRHVMECEKQLAIDTIADLEAKLAAEKARCKRLSAAIKKHLGIEEADKGETP